MTPEQCEFLAGNEWIQINPQFNLEELHLISGDVGPFEAGMPVWVPLWIAITLRKRRKCTIIPPEWLCVEELKKLVVVEKENANALGKVPRCYMEIAHMLIQYAKEDIPNSDTLRIHIQDLWEQRSDKLIKSSVNFLTQGESYHARMDNVTVLEVSYIKPSLAAFSKEIEVLNKMYHEFADPSSTDQRYVVV